MFQRMFAREEMEEGVAMGIAATVMDGTAARSTFAAGTARATASLAEGALADASGADDFAAGSLTPAICAL